MAGSTAACKISSACSQAFHPLPKVPQELQEPDIPWQAGFAETTQDPQIGLQSGKQALRPMLMHVTPCVLFLGVLHARVHGALHRLRATGRGGREATAGWDRPGRCLRHRLHRAISGGLDNHCPLATAPGDAGRPVFVLMAPPGLALLPAPTRSAPQRLLATAFRLPLVASGVGEVIGFHHPCQWARQLIGQGGIAPPPVPAIAGTDMDAHFPGNAPRRTGAA